MICSEKAMDPTPVLSPGKSHVWRSLVGCSPWGCYESDMTEWLHLHFSLSCIGEGNGNPLQCSCLENPRDGGAWWGPTESMRLHRGGHDWSNLAAASDMFLNKIKFYFKILLYMLHFLDFCQFQYLEWGNKYSFLKLRYS